MRRHGTQACLLAVAMCVFGMPAEARHPDRHRRVTTTTVTSASTTTSTLPSGTPPGFTAVDSAFGALLGEFDAEPMSAHIRSELLKQVGHAQDNVAQAAILLSERNRRAAKAALEHALRWMINMHYRVGSNSGRRGGTDRTKLFALIDPIMRELRTLRQT